MNAENIKIAAAAPGDLDEILSLLSSVGLPLEGVKEHLQDFVLARDERGQLIACAGLERYGEFALLRSVAVKGESQKSGLGSVITTRIIEQAKNAGVREILLLTTTARDFFARRFGFCETARADYDEQFSASPEWNLPRCSSACVMKLCL